MRILGAIAIVFTLLVAGGGFLVARLLESACENTPIASTVSPDLRTAAHLFARNCGATTGFTSQVSILPAGAVLPRSAGNTFIATGGPSAGQTAWGGPDVVLSWEGDVLVVRHDRETRISRREPSIDGTRVDYLPLEAAAAR